MVTHLSHQHPNTVTHLSHQHPNTVTHLSHQHPNMVTHGTTKLYPLLPPPNILSGETLKNIFSLSVYSNKDYCRNNYLMELILVPNDVIIIEYQGGCGMCNFSIPQIWAYQPQPADIRIQVVAFHMFSSAVNVHLCQNVLKRVIRFYNIIARYSLTPLFSSEHFI